MVSVYTDLTKILVRSVYVVVDMLRVDCRAAIAYPPVLI